jgi:hypothetical protein
MSFSLYGVLLQYSVPYTLLELLKAMLARTCPAFTCSCDVLASPHPSSRSGHSLTNATSCPSFPFAPPKSSVVTGIPTDVNWAVLKRPDVVQPPSRESDPIESSFIAARELSDATSALLYNLGNTITLRAKPDQRA